MHDQHAAKKSLIVLALALYLPSPVLSQQPGGVPADRINTERARQQEMSSREWQLRNNGAVPGQPSDEKHVKALMAQTQEDFERILTLHNQFVRAISSDNEKRFDYAAISDAAAEIKKRASRLQITLALRQSPTEAKETKVEDYNDSKIEAALVKLCQEIKSFVTNPIIETPNVVDAKELARARQDLELVIQLSDQIKKRTAQLSKDKH